MKELRFGLYILIFVLLIATVSLYQKGFSFSSGEVISSINKENQYDSSLALMYETSAGSGEYMETTDSNWPTDGYTFNATLSRCENGSTVSFDSTTGKVLVEANVSDKCYIYFDKNNTINHSKYNIVNIMDANGNALDPGDFYWISNEQLSASEVDLKNVETVKTIFGESYSESMIIISMIGFSTDSAYLDFPITITIQVPGSTTESKIGVVGYYNGRYEVITSTAGSGTVTMFLDKI